MLDNIVVQTTAGAQKCLEFLRQHNLGRASFIPLDKLKKGAHDRAVETPEGAQRLFDLLTPLSYSVTPALFLAVGNTLVAPDMDTASRWAYDSNKRWRVVTLSGSLIEATGTMSGGGKTARKGGMRLQVSIISYPFLCNAFGVVSHSDRIREPKIEVLCPTRIPALSLKN